ncbi:hypothetical protein Lesp02_67340 [Lentzea sp. NBRC 105346]|uniref:hypothetical protein n=1 Tax=Lentzea sp. NBRC 105346 TaxID=3032205 RepID=UPI0024A313EA|nr:hypothetical protein [Lentzea sp. NBRC 105346]GLZ34547.1 hypothetical protein Lesp02_67340 [Lentzea sp. NBRC 105346]
MVIRVAAALTCLVIALVLRANGVGAIQLAIFAALAVVTVLLPASAAPALVIAFAAVVMVFADGHPLRLGVLLLIPLLHLVHITSALAAVVPVRAAVAVDALKAPARRFVIIQAIVLGLAAVARLLPDGPTPAPVEVLGLGACAVVLGIVALRI